MNRFKFSDSVADWGQGTSEIDPKTVKFEFFIRAAFDIIGDIRGFVFESYTHGKKFVNCAMEFFTREFIH